MSDINVQSLFPGVYFDNRAQLSEHFKEGDVLLFSGGDTEFRNSDVELLFRQDSNFLYVCGASVPGCTFVLEVGTMESTLFVPDLTESYCVWHGSAKPEEEWKQEFGLTRVLFHNQLFNYIHTLKNEGKLLQLYLINVEKSPFKELVAEGNPDKFKKALFASRAVKTPKEIEIMKETCKLSSFAHRELMKQCKVGLSESHLESLFIHYTSWRGCRHQAYVPIVGTGTNGAILHYNSNTALIKNGHLVVVDAGCEYHGYASDITRTFPANGKFSDEQKLIYSLLLKTQEKIIEEIKPDVIFNDLSQNTKKYLTQGMMEVGFIQNCTLEEAIEANLIRLFMPHGLGHLLGLDVHDSTVYPETPLKTGMIITIEPGIYFIPYLIDQYLLNETKKKYLNIEYLEKFKNFGGIRIEDDVLVTDHGHEVLSKWAPKEINEIEQVMAKQIL